MYKLLCLMIAIMLMVGCSTTSPKYVTKIETVTVYKPVYTPPKAIDDLEPIQRPDLKSNHLNEQDKQNPGKVIKALIESQAQLRTYVEQIENQYNVLLDIYKRPADPIPPTTRDVKTINTK